MCCQWNSLWVKEVWKSQPDLWLDLTELFTQIPSEALAHHVQSDHPAGRAVACLLSLGTEGQPVSTQLILRVIDWHQRWFWLRCKNWQRSYSVTRDGILLSRESSVRWGSWGMERSCDPPPPRGMTPFSPPGPMRWPVCLVPLAKGQPAAVRGHRRAGIRCILAHHKNTKRLGQSTTVQHMGRSLHGACWW